MGKLFASGYAAATASTSAKEIGHLVGGSSVLSVLHEVVISHRTTISAPVAYAIAVSVTTGVLGSTCALTGLSLNNIAPTGNFYGVAGSTSATGLSYIYREVVNSLNGFHYLPTPEERPILKSSGHLVVRREYSTDDLPIDLTFVWEEIG